MRTNIVLDDTLVIQAIALTGVSSKKEVIDLALHQLVEAYKSKGLQKQFFIDSYFEKPIKIKDFTPLNRDTIYER